MKYKVFASGIEVIKKAGVYATEWRVDNRFSVDISVELGAEQSAFLDYETLVQAVLTGAQHDFKWLEEWAEAIKVYLQNKAVKGAVELVIHKHHPDFEKAKVAETGVRFVFTL